MSPNLQRVALITGASSGIGAALSRVFARHGHDLLLVARSADALSDLAGEIHRETRVSVKVLSLDLSSPGIADELYRWTVEKGISVEVLVNNAGFGVFGRFAETDVRQHLALIQTNIATVTHLTGLFLPHMLHQGYGRILNVSSTAGFQAGPLLATYYASKSYVTLFTEALSHELKRTGVTASVLCPGPVRTEFHARAGMKRAHLLRFRSPDTMHVAEVAYRGTMQGKPVVIPGLHNRLHLFALRLVPRRLVHRIVRWLQKPRG